MHPIIAKIQSKYLKRVPEIKTGYTVRVSQKVTEGSKERIQDFEGLVIKVGHGAGVEKTFTVRKIVEGIGVEKMFPFHSPNLVAIKVIKKAKVRREKLYYMRDRSGKSARLSETPVTDEERKAGEAKMDAAYEEAMEAEKKRQAKEEEGAGTQSEEKISTPDETPSPETNSQTSEVTEVQPATETDGAESKEEKAA